MKTSLWCRLLCGALICAMMSWALPVHADDDALLLKQAEKLVHDVLNPGGDMLTGDDAIQKLQKAKELTIAAPQRFRAGTRMNVIRLLRSAIESLKGGADAHQVFGTIKDADEALRDAISTST